MIDVDESPLARGIPRARTTEEYQALYAQSLREPERFWAEQARTFSWFHPPHSILDVELEEELTEVSP